MLLDECARPGADAQPLRNLESVPTLNEHDYRYQLQLQTDGRPQLLRCKSLVVAPRRSRSDLGGSGIGYEIAGSSGLRLPSAAAGLVPFMFSDATKAFV